VTKAKTRSLVDEIDEFAKELMQEARSVNDSDETAGIPLQTKLDVFGRVAQWIGIKNRLTDLDQGAAIDEFKRRLKEGRNTEAGKRKARHFRNFPDGDGGSALDAIKSRIPQPDAGDDASAGDDLEC